MHIELLKTKLQELLDDVHSPRQEISSAETRKSFAGRIKVLQDYLTPPNIYSGQKPVEDGSGEHREVEDQYNDLVREVEAAKFLVTKVVQEKPKNIVREKAPNPPAPPEPTKTGTGLGETHRLHDSFPSSQSAQPAHPAPATQPPPKPAKP